VGVTVVETLLVYVGAPLAVIVVLALLTLVPGRQKRARYRPGQPWEHAPVWYEPHHEGESHDAGHGDGHAALGAGGATALTAGSPAAAPAVGGPRGGARGTW
jgi:membrane-associated phospholipid phosphatase